MKRSVLLFGALGLALTVFAQSADKKTWTIIYYAAGGNSSEQDLMSDVDEMMRGKKNDTYNLIMLIDRAEGYSNDESTLDGNFTDTRMYSIHPGEYKRLKDLSESKDENMGDAHVLAKFIDRTKREYPAEHYLLVLRSHGNGVGMCPDAENGPRDNLYPAELTDVLGPEHSVDVLGLDVCSMAGIENLYQWRPRNSHFSADFVMASAPLSGAWAYDHLLERIEDAASVSPRQMTLLLYQNVEEYQRWASWGAFDNRKVEEVKKSMDRAAHLLALESMDVLYAELEATLGYFHQTSDDEATAQLAFPYLDAYDYWLRLSTCTEISEESRNAALEVCAGIDALVLDSYYGRGFLPPTDRFVDGRSGVYQILPLGRKIYPQSGQTFWSHCNWFSGEARTDDAYGRYDWCNEGATSDGSVGNFYQLLEKMYVGSGQ